MGDGGKWRGWGPVHSICDARDGYRGAMQCSPRTWHITAYASSVRCLGGGRERREGGRSSYGSNAISVQLVPRMCLPACDFAVALRSPALIWGVLVPGVAVVAGGDRGKAEVGFCPTQSTSRPPHFLRQVLY
eukprot:803694-Rhodomonas_salina.5